MTISNNICKTHEFKDAIYYNAICNCGSDNHNQSLEVEIETHSEIFMEVSLKIHSKIITDRFINWTVHYEFEEACSNGDYFGMAYYKARYILSNILTKIKFTKKIWVDGYVEASNIFSFRNEACIDDYIQALTEAKQKLK